MDNEQKAIAIAIEYLEKISVTDDLDPWTPATTGKLAEDALEKIKRLIEPKASTSHQKSALSDNS